MKKKIASMLLCTAVAVAAMTGCASSSSSAQEENSVVEETGETEESTETETAETETIETEAAETAEEETGFVLEYTAAMQEQGYEALELESRPERVVCLSAAPVLALYELNVNIVGVVNSSVVTWPEDLSENAETLTFSAMSDNFDSESVVALEPDLVLISSSVKDTAGATLESVGIAVYYVDAGHTVSYESIKEQTQVFIDAFATNEESQAGAEKILEAFEQVEERAAAASEALEGKTVMVLQSSGDSHYIQTSSGTLGTMADIIGFTNVYENESSAMVLLDLEQALDYDPDLVMCVGATSAKDHQAAMEEAFAANEDYWYSIDAIAEGNVIYLPIDFCSTAGINIVNNLNDLMDTVAEFYGLDF